MPGWLNCWAADRDVPFLSAAGGCSRGPVGRGRPCHWHAHDPEDLCVRLDRAHWLQRHEGGVLGPSSDVSPARRRSANKHGGLQIILKPAINVVGHASCRNEGVCALD